MSLITTTPGTSIQPSAPEVPQQIYSAGRERFAGNFNQHPFAVDHSLSNHPAFTLDRMQELLERSLSIPDKVYWNAGKRGIGQKWKDKPGRDFSVEEAFRRIRETDAWITIFGAERDPEIHALLEAGLAEVQQLSGLPLDREAKNSGSIIFITSPRRITEYHIDRECSMLLQIYGKKTIHVFDRNDRDVLTEEELERFWTVDNNAATYKPDLQDRASSFFLEPGKAVHIPVNAPHWLENGDDISVSVNQNIQYRNDKLANVYRANYYMRKVGLNPLPPGQSRLQDRLKGHGMNVPVSLAKKLIAAKKKILHK
ncbi:MAG: hypothetical protein ABI164_06570 [Acidobacteriaceae bacterium]